LRPSDDDLNNPDASHIHELRDQFEEQIVLKFDMEQIVIMYANEFRASDQPISNMLLESLGRHNVSELRICGLCCSYGQDKLQKFFSLKTLRRFLETATMLNSLVVQHMVLGADVCDILGRFSRGLDLIEFRDCSLNFQRFANAAGANVDGPKWVHFNACIDESGLDFTSIITPLLDNPSMKVFHLTTYGHAHSIGNMEVLKAAFESCQSLEELHISNDLFIQNSDQLMLLLQVIAAAPKLRTLSLRLQGFDNVASPQELSEMFANALIACENTSLEVFVFTFSVDETVCDKTIWKREVTPIFEFNIQRRLFQESAISSSYDEAFNQSLELLDKERENHHLCYWLVRNYAWRLTL
jgi:hypothetical protein